MLTAAASLSLDAEPLMSEPTAPAIIGTNDDDVIGGTPGDDVIKGLGGDDFIAGAMGADTIVGGAGDDVIQGNGGNDVIFGGGGDDVLRGNEGDDYVDGGAGRNRFSNFDFRGVKTGVTVSLLLQGQAQDTGHGMDTLVHFQDLSGTELADVLTGDGHGNFLFGYDGDDLIEAGGGDDIVAAGLGDQTLDGGLGQDWIVFSSAAEDTPDGIQASLARQGEGQETGLGVITLTGFENLEGSFSTDVLRGDGRDNIIAGGLGADAMSGGDGADALYGDGGFNYINPGPDQFVSQLDDVPDFGASGDDTLWGGGGDDTLAGGRGADKLIGGDSDDVFQFLSLADSSPDGRDTIADLQAADVIDLSAIDADTSQDGDQAFQLVAALDGHAAQAALVFDAVHDRTDLELDVDGDGQADMVVAISGDHRDFTNFAL